VDQKKKKDPPTRMPMRIKGGRVKSCKVRDTKDGQEGQREHHRTAVGRLKI
jgi:hypothetical protein